MKTLVKVSAELLNSGLLAICLALGAILISESDLNGNLVLVQLLQFFMMSLL